MMMEIEGTYHIEPLDEKMEDGLRKFMEFCKTASPSTEQVDYWFAYATSKKRYLALSKPEQNNFVDAFIKMDKLTNQHP